MINEVPEIAFCVKDLSRALSRPSEEDMRDLKQVIRFTRGVDDEWLHITIKREIRIEVFIDADWAGDTTTRRSTSSSFVMINGFLISVNSQLQKTQAQSSGEIEFYAIGAGNADGLYVHGILEELGLRSMVTIRSDASAIRSDASAGRGAATRPGLSNMM